MPDAYEVRVAKAPDDLAACFAVRREVFVGEQNVPVELEYDERDATAVHVLAVALPERTWVEDVEDAGFADLGALVEPTGCRIEDGWFTAGDRPGLGFSFRSAVAVTP